MDPQGKATFTTIRQIEAATITVTAGPSPNVAIITMLPQAEDIMEYGTLSFTFDDMYHDFIECKADYGSLTRDRSGLIWRIGIFDRRWKWKFGRIGGQYNLRNPDNSVKKESQKTPQELATLCLDAMGEDLGLWDIGDLPNESNPTVRWDCDNPAQALTSLCDLLGCLMVPHLHQRGGRIAIAGTGADMPEGGEESRSITFDPPETPSKIAIVCGPDRFEVDFDLEAVGEESDEKGTIKKIDDLSYKPVDGWDHIVPGAYAGIFTAKDKDKNPRECAERSVFKWYRIKIPEGGIVIPGYDKTVHSLDQVLLEDRLVDVVVDELNEISGDGTLTSVEKTRRRPAIVYGIWCHTQPNGRMGNYASTIDPKHPNDNKYTGDFSIDATRRMVKFSRHMYKNFWDNFNEAVIPFEAEIKLRTACTLLDTVTYEPVRTYKERETGAEYDTHTRIIRHDEIVLCHDGEHADGVNRAEVDAELDYYLDAAMKEYDPKIPQSATYMGLRRLDLDGAIRQVTYEVDKSGARTTVARNTEDIDRVEPYRQKRARQRDREAIQKLQDVRNAVDDRSADVKFIA